MSFVNEKLNRFNEDVKGKKIAIIGLGVSNMPLVDYFNEWRQAHESVIPLVRHRQRQHYALADTPDTGRQ